MAHQDPSFILSQALAALGDLPANVTAGSRLGTYELQITGTAAGRFTARSISQRPPVVKTELSIRAVSGQRLRHTIDCVVFEQVEDVVELEVRSIHKLRGRRSADRSPIKELFLIYSQTEIDAEVQDVSQDGMRFHSPVKMAIGSQLRGMLNVAGQVIPVAAEVRHSTKHTHGFIVGVRFRHLRDEEHALLATVTEGNNLGRRDDDHPSIPPLDDVRERLRRWAA
jgi:PilZ domain-containing protein